MQYLEAKIPIPEGYVIISKDYEELKKADDTGRWMTLPEVLERINRNMIGLLLGFKEPKI